MPHPLRVVIVGGVAGGASAAAKARRANESADITLFEKGPYVSFANCGLPYYIGGDIPDRGDLFLQTPEKFWTRFRVRVHVGHEVIRIDRAAREVEVKNLATGAVFRAPYDRLILAPGAGAVVPPVAGLPAENIFTVKTVPDSDAVRAFLEKNRPRRAVVVGAGFIGLESAEALTRWGVAVTLVELESQVLPPFDPDMSAFVGGHLRASGVALELGRGLKAFHGGPRAREIELTDGHRLPMDMAILSIGVRPELKLAREAGLTIGAAGGIAVNDRQQTSDPDIFAAGDAVEVVHAVTGKTVRMPLAGPANKQGRVAGANAAGESLVFPGAVGTAIVECLGITAAKTGLSEKEARRLGMPVQATTIHSLDHAGYYPGGELLHIKIISDPGDGRLLGAQVVGEKGVDKRIDVLATALAARMKVTDLETLDLAYAPAFSSAKDPVILAGFVASNALRGEERLITCDDFRQRRDRGEAFQLVDVRTAREFARDRLEGAINIPLDELRDRLPELNPAAETVVTCQVGLRAHVASRVLLQNGFARVSNLTGGMTSCAADRPTPNPAPAAEPLPSVVSVRKLRDWTAPNHPRGALGIDVREPDEHRWERPPRCRNVPLSRLDAERPTLPKDRDLLFFCQTGFRSAKAVEDLRRAGWTRVAVVDGGVAAWKNAGFKTEKSSRVLPLMRQVQIVAGSLVVIGGLWSGPGRWLAVAVGAGLVFAGASGYCGLARVLGFLPWNRAPKPPGGPA